MLTDKTHLGYEFLHFFYYYPKNDPSLEKLLKDKDKNNRELIFKFKNCEQEGVKLLNLIKDFIKNENNKDIVIIFIPSSNLEKNEKRKKFVGDNWDIEFPYYFLDIKHNLEASHNGGSRDFNELKNNIVIPNNLTNIEIQNKKIIIIDDIITSGNHYHAIISVLKDFYFKKKGNTLNSNFLGVFIAKTSHHYF